MFLIKKISNVINYLTILIGTCCSSLKITATGLAKTKQSSRLGNFEYNKQGSNGKAIYKQTPKNASQSYLYVDPYGSWAVRNVIS